jgi:hypothetical protein
MKSISKFLTNVYALCVCVIQVVNSPSTAPTAVPETSGSDDDDGVNEALAIGLAVPLGLLSLFCLVYFAWYRNSCGVFAQSDSLKVPLIEDDQQGHGAGEETISKETGSSSNV